VRRSAKAADGADCVMTATTTEGGEMVPPEPSEAAGDQPLMISQRMRGRGTDQTGTWVAAGAIDDEGTARITQIQSTDQDDGTLLIEATHLLVSDADEEQMIELRSETILQPFPPPPPQKRVLVEGPWRLISGTKRYANLRARGRLYATITDRAVGNTRRREITLVRDGSAR
jgi:hypothetical protein